MISVVNCAVLMEATKICSLGQLTQAMFEVEGSTGGKCRHVSY